MSDDVNPPPDAVCGCDCKCTRPLTTGNVMEEEVFQPPRSEPWEIPSPDDAADSRIFLLLCVECYTGNHAPFDARDPQ